MQNRTSGKHISCVDSEKQEVQDLDCLGSLFSFFRSSKPTQSDAAIEARIRNLRSGLEQETMQANVNTEKRQTLQEATKQLRQDQADAHMRVNALGEGITQQEQFLNRVERSQRQRHVQVQQNYSGEPRYPY